MMIKGNLMKHERIMLSENIKGIVLFAFFFVLTITLPMISYSEITLVFAALNQHQLIFEEQSFGASLILGTPVLVMLTRLMFLKVRNIEIKPELLIKWYKLCGLL